MSSTAFRRVPERITTVDELRDILGKDFVIFAGSAVSAYPVTINSLRSSFLPMVPDFLGAFSTLLANRLHMGNYFERTLSSYANEFASGHLQNLKKGTKFEQFLWQLQTILGSNDSVKSLLRSLYFCENKLFCPNHQAIAQLLETHRSIGCITTNFDNGIENASGIIPFVHPYQSTIQDFTQGMFLLKLHGDVIQETYVATNPDLLSGEVKQSYQYLETLLAGKTVLVVGYSGNGDIDVAPHLENAIQKGTKLVWVIRAGDKPPKYATYWYSSDLHASDPNSNCLLALAGNSPSFSTLTQSKPDWEARFEKWFDNQAIGQLSKIVAAVFQNRHGWALLHLDYVNQWYLEQNNVSQDPFDPAIHRGFRLIGIGAYKTARQVFNSITSATYSELSSAKYHFWQGFADWRLHLLDEAISNFDKAITYWDAFPTPSLGSPIPTNSNVADIPPRDKAEILRLYLEVARDKLITYTSLVDRKHFYRNFIEKRIIQLQNQSIQDIEQSALRDLVIFHIRYLIGEVTVLKDIQHTYDIAINLQSLDVAAEAARILVSINLWRSINPIFQTSRNLLKERRYNTFLQNLAATLDTMLLGRWLYFSVILMNFKTRRTEKRYQEKISLWHRAFLQDEILTE